MLLGLAFWINGGFNPPLRSLVAQVLSATALFGSALFAVAIEFIPSISLWALRPGAQVDGIRNELLFIAVLTAAIGLGMSLTINHGAVSN